MTKIGEQKMIVAASPTGSRANPIKMQVTVRHPIRPKLVVKKINRGDVVGQIPYPPASMGSYFCVKNLTLA